jgi:hypothetical protein
MPDSYSVALTYPASRDFLADVALLAFTPGAIDYWCAIENVTRKDDAIVSFDLREHEGYGADPVRVTVTHEVLAEGFRRVLAPEFKVRDDIRQHVARALLENDCCDIDVEVADVLVQAAALGTLRYG